MPSASSLACYSEYGRGYLGGASSELLHEEKDFNHLQVVPYGMDGVVGRSYHPELRIRQGSDIGTLAACSGMRGYSSILDYSNPSTLHMRREFSAGTSSGIAENGTSGATGGINGLKAPERESNMILVNGLPSVPAGKSIKGDKYRVLCFVEFDNLKCAYTAMESLQGYQFEHKKPDSSVLRIRFAHFPLRLSSEEPIKIVC